MNIGNNYLKVVQERFRSVKEQGDFNPTFVTIRSKHL